MNAIQNFQAHGLIQDEATELLYRQALHRYANRVQNPEEWRSTVLVENILNRVIFFDPCYTIVSQVPPFLGETATRNHPLYKRAKKQRCDLLVNVLTTQTLEFKPLVWFEVKKASSKSQLQVTSAEDQLDAYLFNYLLAHDLVNFIFGAVVIGVSIRFFWLRRDANGDPQQRMTAFWNPTTTGLFSEYIDIGDEGFHPFLTAVIQHIQHQVIHPNQLRVIMRPWSPIEALQANMLLQVQRLPGGGNMYRCKFGPGPNDEENRHRNDFVRGFVRVQNGPEVEFVLCMVINIRGSNRWTWNAYL